MIYDKAKQMITAEHGGSFVSVTQAGLTPGRVIEYKGLVTELREDAHGPLVIIRVWHRGRLMKDAAARPADCLVITAPKVLRHEQCERARRSHEAKLQAEEADRQKRLLAAQRARS